MVATENSEPPPTESEAETTPRRRGRRGTEPTIQVSLRLPASHVDALRERAFIASRQEQHTITPQEIMRRMIETALKSEN